MVAIYFSFSYVSLIKLSDQKLCFCNLCRGLYYPKKIRRSLKAAIKISNLTNQDFNQYQQGVFECSLLVFFDNSQLRRYLTMDCFITREACKVCETQDQAITKEPGKTTKTIQDSFQSYSTMRKDKQKTVHTVKTRIPLCRPSFALLGLAKS